jgi:amino acid adenylation domain-containing protein
MTYTIEQVLLYSQFINPTQDFNEKTALITEQDTLSYSQLRQSILAGANWLIESGCNPGDCIGVCLPKNLSTVQAIYATLAAGAVFLPIDPGAPPARVAYILADANATRLITHAYMADALNQLEQPLTIPVTVLDTNQNFQSLTNGIKSNHDLPVRRADDTAMLYYTSGTTGNPKAIMLSHANVNSFTEWAIKTFNINSNDRVASHAPFHFDLSTLDLFAATRVGASVVLIDEADVKFPAKIGQLIESSEISVWYSVPTALVQLLRFGALERRNLESLRLVLFAGEVFPVQELSKLIQKLPHCEFVNLYGPTETNVCTYYRITRPPGPDARDIPIGIACEHLQVKLYQQNGTETLPGESGEIVVFGPAVMQGYKNQPELTTKSRFKNNSQSYCTGDFAYLDKDGQLHLIGRKDDQVKIRGHRVELMEISSVLTLHQDIMESVVLLSKVPDGDSALVAFVVPEPGRSITIEKIQDHCRQWLPKYALPKNVFILDHFPRTTTGKIDRQKLKQLLI